jgi:uncharacterized protein with FMN-binding domain
MPKRAVAACVTTALALVLLFSFKTPATPVSALGGPGQVAVIPGPSTNPAPTTDAGTGTGVSGPLTSTPPAAEPSHRHRLPGVLGATPAPPAAGATPAPPAAGATPAPTNAASKGSGTFTGAAVQYPYGQVQVQITLVAGKITDVVAQMPDQGRSGFISQSVAPILQSEVLSAQSANINTVSGATYTSEAYAQSLQSAIDQAHG